MLGDPGQVQNANLRRDTGKHRPGHLETAAEHAGQVQNVTGAGDGRFPHRE